MGCAFTGIFSMIFAGLGLAYRGLYGGIVGFFFGTLLDILISRLRGQRTMHYYQSHDFTEHELHLAAYVAKADQNRLLRSEMTYVQEYFRQRVGSNRLGALMLRFRDILDSDINIQGVCANLNKHASINEKLVIIHFLFGFSNADGDMRAEEINAIWEIAQMIGLSRTTFEAVRSMFGTSSYEQRGYSQSAYGGKGSTGMYTTHDANDNDYKILEVSPDASDDEVKKAYRTAAKKHHPDKVSHLGEEVRKNAEEKFAKVNEAYERIKRTRGMN